MKKLFFLVGFLLVFSCSTEDQLSPVTEDTENTEAVTPENSEAETTEDTATETTETENTESEDTETEDTSSSATDDTEYTESEKILHKENVPYPAAYFDEFLVGMELTEAEKELFVTNANRFIDICIGQNFFLEDENGVLKGLKNPLWEIYNSGSWPIYFHFEEYEGAI